MKNQEKRYYPDFKDSILLFFLHVVIIFIVTFIAATVIGMSLGAGGAAAESAELSKKIEGLIKEYQVYISMAAVIISAGILTLITLKSRKQKFNSFLFDNLEAANIKLLGLITVTAVSLSLFAGRILDLFVKSGMNDPELVKALRGNVGIIFALVLAPIFEEIIFRGIIFDGLISNHPKAVAFIVSSLFFSISHGKLVQFIPTFLAGLFFAYIYHKTGSLILTMFTHFAYNIIPIIAVQIADLDEELMASGEENILFIIVPMIIFAGGMAGLSYYFKKSLP